MDNMGSVFRKNEEFQKRKREEPFKKIMEMRAIYYQTPMRARDIYKISRKELEGSEWKNLYSMQESFSKAKMEVITMMLEESKTLYKGEWIAFRTFEENDNPEGEVVLHNKDRRAFDKKLLQLGLTDVYITFAGPTVPEGYAVIF